MNRVDECWLQTPAVIPAKINPIPAVFPHKSVLFLQETHAVCSHTHGFLPFLFPCSSLIQDSNPEMDRDIWTD